MIEMFQIVGIADDGNIVVSWGGYMGMFDITLRLVDRCKGLTQVWFRFYTE